MFEFLVRDGVHLRAMNMRSAPPSGGRSGGAAADEDLHRMDICVGWMYEFSSRHRMEDVQEGTRD